MKKLIFILFLITWSMSLSLIAYSANEEYEYPEFAIQATMEEILQVAKEGDIPDSDPLVQRAKQLLRESRERYLYDRDTIATVVYNEAGYGCSDRHMELVAAVIYNRLKSDLFPNTIYEIVTAPKQYHPLYAEPDSKYGRMARNSNVWEKCKKIAEKALKGEIECPDEVYYQANFPQGSSIYEIHDTSYSRTWFCFE